MNDSDDYYNQKSESRSKILKPITYLFVIAITLGIWYFIIKTITEALLNMF